MTRKRAQKPYWEMTTAELAEATAEFDQTMVIDQFKPLTPELRARWERAKAKHGPAKDHDGEQIIAVRLDKALLDRCTALAKQKRISRDALITRGLKAILAAEGEGEPAVGATAG